MSIAPVLCDMHTSNSDYIFATPTLTFLKTCLAEPETIEL